jgi:predicted aconitase with swiveling domain
MLREMAARNKAPLALLLNFANPIMAQGAAFGGIPLMDRFEGDVTALIRSGDRLRVIPARGEVIIICD